MSTLGQFAGRRILLLNWRDLSNPQAGGAEEYAEQIARRFASAGALLTLFTSQYEGAPPYDWAREYLVVREGGRFGVYLAAARHLERYGRRYDAPHCDPIPSCHALVAEIHHDLTDEMNAKSSAAALLQGCQQIESRQIQGIECLTAIRKNDGDILPVEL